VRTHDLAASLIAQAACFFGIGPHVGSVMKPRIRSAAFAVSVTITRMKLDVLGPVLNRGCPLAVLEENIVEGIPGINAVRIERDGLLEISNGGGVLAAPRLGQPALVVSLGFAGIARLSGGRAVFGRCRPHHTEEKEQCECSSPHVTLGC
jgi:hypothetical protein